MYHSVKMLAVSGMAESKCVRVRAAARVYSVNVFVTNKRKKTKHPGFTANRLRL